MGNYEGLIQSDSDGSLVVFLVSLIVSELLFFCRVSIWVQDSSR